MLFFSEIPPGISSIVPKKTLPMIFFSEVTSEFFLGTASGVFKKFLL